MDLFDPSKLCLAIAMGKRFAGLRTGSWMLAEKGYPDIKLMADVLIFAEFSNTGKSQATELPPVDSS